MKERWIAQIVTHNRQQIIREAEATTIVEALTKTLSGINARRPAVAQALVESGLEERPFESWSRAHAIKFAGDLVPRIKPSLIMANKVGLHSAEDNIEKLAEYFSHGLVAACSAEAEPALRRAQKAGLLHYNPGQEKFRVVENAELTQDQMKAMAYVEDRVMSRWLRTGIQQALNTLVFKVLRMNMVYPVADEAKLADTHGNVLPDAYLMPPGSTPSTSPLRTIHASWRTMSSLSTRSPG